MFFPPIKGASNCMVTVIHYMGVLWEITCGTMKRCAVCVVDCNLVISSSFSLRQVYANVIFYHGNMPLAHSLSDSRVNIIALYTVCVGASNSSPTLNWIGDNYRSFWAVLPKQQIIVTSSRKPWRPTSREYFSMSNEIVGVFSIRKGQHSHLHNLDWILSNVKLVLSPDPTLTEKKGLVTIWHPARP